MRPPPTALAGIEAAARQPAERADNREDAAGRGPGRQNRYLLVDALRGIAALGVLFHHMLHNSVMEPTLRAVLPGWTQWLSQEGAGGVEIFFVLSGFVIAHSVRNLRLSARGIGNFVLRRQFRLDPPYWAMIALTCLNQIAVNHLPHFRHYPLPAPGAILANMLYVFNILHWDGILAVAWTLCIEIQFYLVFILLIAVGQRRCRCTTAEYISPETQSLVAGVACVSLSFLGRHTPNNDRWFVAFWLYFAAGALVYWNHRGRISRTLPVALIAACLLASAATGSSRLLIGAATAALLCLAGYRGGLSAWLRYRPFQYFGRISYSLYLVHLVVATDILKLGYKLTGENHTAAAMWFLFAGAVSIGVAHLFYVAVERPSIRLASRFRLQDPIPPTRPGEHTKRHVSRSLG